MGFITHGNVQMIGYSVYRDQFMTIVLNRAGNVFIKLTFPIGIISEILF
jgi:hypothetical protein